MASLTVQLASQFDSRRRKRFYELVGNLLLVSGHPDDAIPNVVYHYTGLAGLAGILEGNAIWASNYAFLNDSTENAFALPRARSFVQSVPAASKAQKALVAAILKELEQPPAVLYVASFCLKPDLLSMWRGYGSHATGRFAIGLQIVRGEDEDESRSVLEPRGWRSGKVAYTLAQQKRWTMDRIVDMVADLKDEDAPLILALANRCALHVSTSLPFLKMHPFKEEREWRAVRVDPSERAKLDSSRGRLYLEYRPHWKGSSKQQSKDLPITEIWIGPTPDKFRTKRRVEILLDYFGKKVPIRVSGIPLQDW